MGTMFSGLCSVLDSVLDSSQARDTHGPCPIRHVQHVPSHPVPRSLVCWAHKAGDRAVAVARALRHPLSHQHPAFLRLQLDSLLSQVPTSPCVFIDIPQFSRKFRRADLGMISKTSSTLQCNAHVNSIHN